MALQPLITDRTFADQEYAWANRTKPTGAWLKGAYNPAKDWKRVLEWLAYLAAEYTKLGYSFLLKSKKTAWTTADVILKIDADNYIADVREVLLKVPIDHSHYPLPTTLVNLDYEGANNIEKNIDLANKTLSIITKSTIYSNEIYSSEV